MPVKKESTPKICYTRNEVAEMYGISPEAITYWEKAGAFTSELSGGGGVRYYYDKQLRVIERLNYLVNTKGYKVKAAIQHLRQRGGEELEYDIVQRLGKVRARLLALAEAADALAKASSELSSSE